MSTQPRPACPTAATGTDREFILVGQSQGGFYDLYDIAPAPVDGTARARALEEIGVDAMDALADVNLVWATSKEQAIAQFSADLAEVSGLARHPVIRRAQEPVHSRVASATASALVGVDVEVRPGRAGFHLEGDDRGGRQTRDRVRAAILNAGLGWPAQTVTVRYYTAGARLGALTSSLDLAVAVAVLAASGQLAGTDVEGIAFVGELGLDGALRPALGITDAAHVLTRHGHNRIFAPGHSVAVWPASAYMTHAGTLQDAADTLTRRGHHPAECLHREDGPEAHAVCVWGRPCRACLNAPAGD